jgi:nicotinamide-nucleotide adenylyltransferase
MIASIVGRFKPLHNGAASLITQLCSRFERVNVGIGSANKYDARNPFTPVETEEMLYDFASFCGLKNIVIHRIDDVGDGEKWAKNVYQTLGSSHFFVSGNEYVIDLLKNRYYQILHASQFVTPSVRATEVRIDIANNDKVWVEKVPRPVAAYILERRIDKRVREEFGDEILSVAPSDWRDISLAKERERTGN